MSADVFDEYLPQSAGTVGEIPSVSEQAGSAPDLKRGRRRKSPERELPERLPPKAYESEQGVLGCILLNPAVCLPICIAKFVAGEEVFYDLRHQVIYANMVSMFDNRKEIDTITLQQRLKDFGMLDQVGGIPYLNSLQDSVPSAANLSYYLDIVQDKYLLRKLIETCTDILSKVYTYEGSVDTLFDGVERDILAIYKTSSAPKEVTIKELVQLAITEIEKKYESNGAITGLPTGLPDLDYYTDGLHPGETTILAAFPSTGKTSLAMNIAENIVLNLKLPVGVFSLEMTSVALVKRSLCSTARINVRAVTDGKMKESDFPKLTGAAGRMSAAKIYFDDSTDTSIYQVRAKARRMVQQYGIKLLIVDYLQMLNASGGNRKLESRQQEIADISNGLKSMSKELNIPVLALSQLTETANGPRLRGSGDILQDADGVWMLELPKPDVALIKETSEICQVDLWIRKQRNGPRNVCVNMLFNKGFTRFESMSKVAQDEEYQFPEAPPPENELPMESEEA